MSESIKYTFQKGKDIITVIVLEDGMIRTETDKISMANHASAASFLDNVRTLLGGTLDIVKKFTTSHVHHHAHGEQESEQ